MVIIACVELPPTPFIKTEQVLFKKERYYINLKLLRDPASETSETYEIKLALFKNGKPE